MSSERPEPQGRLLTEITRLAERVDAHSDRVSSRLDAQDAQLEDIRKELKANTHLITGNGSPERGIVVRLDRIEQAGKRRDALLKILVGAVISGTVGLVFGFVKLFMLKGGNP